MYRTKAKPSSSRWSSIIECAEQVIARAPVVGSNSQQQLAAIAFVSCTASSRVPCQTGCDLTTST